MAFGPPREPVAGLDEAIRRCQDYLLEHQHPDGYWWGELESNVTITAEYLLLTHFLGVADPGRWKKIVAYLRSMQREDGAWSVWYGGPPDLNCSIEAYFAMKLAGVPASDPALAKARDFILARGGIIQSRVFTRTWLALFGQFDWEALPRLPVEAFLLPRWFPFNLYEFSAWARPTIVPLLVIDHFRPVVPVPAWANIDELYVDRRDRGRRRFLPAGGLFTWRRFFLGADRVLQWADRSPWKPLRRVALRRAERWIIEHQEADGSWGGIQPPWVYSLMALKCLGHRVDGEYIAKGLRGFEGFAHDDGERFWTESCLSPVWDTALAAIGLLDSGLPPDHPALQQAAAWLLDEQIATGGDWQAKVKGVEPGGWAFEFHNDLYPDTDDTSEVIMALDRIRTRDEVRKREAIERGARWLLGMQSRNGGWGSFDRDNDRRFITRIPFADFGETIDPPSEDVTAHIVEMFAQLGYAPHHPALLRARAYLEREQHREGPWWGRWGVNYLYGTGAVVPALVALGEPAAGLRLRKAVAWIRRKQNEDGGWGETIESYYPGGPIGEGPSTASQTAWALIALIAAGEEHGDAVRRGVEYLVRTQDAGGDWAEPFFTGTGFPRDFMIKYHLYRVYFPLWALGRYRQRVQTPSAATHEPAVLA